VGRQFIVIIGVAVLGAIIADGWLGASKARMANKQQPTNESFEVTRSDAEWRATLTPRQYAVLRKRGTESPGTSPLLGEHRAGTFACAACGQTLFLSETKFESGSGWPSFYDAVGKAVSTNEDRTLGMRRVEIYCSRCGGHLGHVFPDGPRPTGLRYCTNGVSLTFKPTSSE
jgi:peptide-methionine (R)-S-oxide reductase